MHKTTTIAPCSAFYLHINIIRTQFQEVPQQQQPPKLIPVVCVDYMTDLMKTVIC